ncbi:zinc-binding metallopeptidase [Flavobacterium taihuense]|uniref:Zinc-binding metallopeptidase n=1 Tax=Flavobacterium taihuense TaxID=2857508 RepID=A0ABS6XW37_9FLAO|nr:putative zinc-binding metallopeptidase [Flavobacterium taihuense]MBW4360893.1 putative zinc-binding metallopeptidase [Flavobacterium taihuense]
MKFIQLYKKALLISTLVLLSACSSEESLTASILDTTKPQQSELDVWIGQIYLTPYNIEVLYKWNQNLVDGNRYLYPPTQTKIKPALEIVQRIWLNTYTTIGGSKFVKLIAPRQLVLVGGVNLNSTGTKTLGEAEGGQRITLFETDYVDKTDRESVKQFIHTIQHEYIHILNQHKPFDEKSFAKITPTGYTANWYETKDAEANEEGFITAYAKSNIIEDFAEMASMMLVNSKDEYEAIIAGITNPKAQSDIRAKEALVVKYFKEAFNIDFYKLRAEAEKNTADVIAGN